MLFRPPTLSLFLCQRVISRVCIFLPPTTFFIPLVCRFVTSSSISNNLYNQVQTLIMMYNVSSAQWFQLFYIIFLKTTVLC